MDKVCILTGASSGIGRAVALRIASGNQFGHIALIGRNKEELDQVKILIEKAGTDCSVWITDLFSQNDLSEIVDNIYKTTGRIDCLMNIAGYTDPQPLLGTTVENLEKTFGVNVFTLIILTKEVVKHMKSCGGKILNVASTAGMSARPGWLSYAASKAAVISISQTLAEELYEYGIKVYCVSPGRCATKLRAKLAPDEDPTTIMQPEEVAAVVCELIDADGNCLDGQNIVIRRK